MNAIKRNIPNIITLANLFCGLCAILFVFEGYLSLAAILIFCSICFDFLDGLIAQLMNISSEFGKQLDSLADIVSFGVAPGLMLFQLIYFKTTNKFFQSEISDSSIFPAIIALLIPIFSAIRLANFNIDNKQTTSFIGLPTPVLAMFIAAIPLSIHSTIPHIAQHLNLLIIFSDLKFLISIALILPFLLVVKIPLFSLKINEKERLASKLNIFRIILMLVSGILFFLFQFVAIPFIIILYLFLSILNNLLK